MLEAHRAAHERGRRPAAAVTQHLVAVADLLALEREDVRARAHLARCAGRGRCREARARARPTRSSEGSLSGVSSRAVPAIRTWNHK